MSDFVPFNKLARLHREMVIDHHPLPLPARPGWDGRAVRSGVSMIWHLKSFGLGAAIIAAIIVIANTEIGLTLFLLTILCLVAWGIGAIIREIIE